MCWSVGPCVGKGYNIAILHAFLRGIGFQFYLGLLCSTVPVIRICTDGDQFFHFCTAETRISLELGLIKNLRRIRSLGVRTINCVLDLCAIGIRKQSHILRYRKGARRKCLRHPVQSA